MAMANAARSRQQSFHAMKLARTLAPRGAGLAAAFSALAVILAFAGVLNARAKETRKFKYVGGMQMLLRDCAGDLELKNDSLTFRCGGTSESIPYSSIELMQYRPTLSSKIRKLAIHWEVVPSVAMPTLPKKRNRFFAVIYSEPASPSASARIVKGMVLEVSPETMQPYVAEIELKSNKRVEVYNHEEYY